MAEEAVLSEGRHAHHLSCHGECAPNPHAHTRSRSRLDANTGGNSAPAARLQRRGFLSLAGRGELTWMGCHGNSPLCPAPSGRRARPAAAAPG